MNELHNKNILLGITGGIAAYKAAELCRLFIKRGARVRVVMTGAAQEFIRPLTFQALTDHKVYTDLFDADASNAMDHINLARWADLIIIAPATADYIARQAAGYADNLLLTIVLATEKTIAIAPAMNQQMYQNLTTAENIQTLRDRGVLIWGPDEGDQACGETGPGRMLEPENLLQRANNYFKPGKLMGRKLMITAGPTREAIDPVRYISNRSSGKMGYALAEAARDAGAEVTLVSGPVCLSVPQGARLLSCLSAQDMLEQVMSAIAEQDIFIASAAVADYRMDKIETEKIKKSSASLTLKLARNPDILNTVSSLDKRPFCVGFAAETQNLEEYAKGKMTAKKLDMIAANLVNDPASGFDVDMNALSVFWKNGKQELPQQSKKDIAIALIDIIAEIYD